MFLVDSNAFANDPEATTEGIMKVLDRAGANVVAHRPWQDGKLAYEIEGRRKGTHYIVCFKMPSSGMDVLTRQSQLSDTILRQIVVRHTQELFDAVVGAISTDESAEASEGASEEAPKGEPAKVDESDGA